MMKSGHVFRDRKFILLAALILLLVVINFRRWDRESRISGRALEKSTNHQKVSHERDPILMADRLDEQKLEFHEEKRNIFSFFQKQPDPPIAVKTETIAAANPPPVCGNSVCEEGEDLTNCPTDCQPPPPPAPVITLRYIGYMSQSDGSVAFLTDGKEVYMARVNDVVANQYRVLKISEESVELGFLNNNQSSTIRFQGNQGG